MSEDKHIKVKDNESIESIVENMYDRQRKREKPLRVAATFFVVSVIVSGFLFYVALYSRFGIAKEIYLVRIILLSFLSEVLIALYISDRHVDKSGKIIWFKRSERDEI